MAPAPTSINDRSKGTLEVSMVLSDTASPVVDAFLAHLTGPGRREVNESIAGVLEAVTRGHVRKLNRHNTATRLGAEPTNHYARQASRITSEATEERASLLFPRVSGLSRAYRTFDIRPKPPRKYLTIPVSAVAYGRSAGELDDLLFLRVGPRKTPVLARKPEGAPEKGALEVLFVLVKRATIPKDRTLLPSDEQFGKSIELGIRNAIRAFAAEARARMGGQEGGNQ